LLRIVITSEVCITEGKELKAAPTVYEAAGIGFVGQSERDLGYVVVLTPKGEEVHIRLEPQQLRTLLALIQGVNSIQTFPDDVPPS
jgi:hypothetical protein